LVNEELKQRIAYAMECTPGLLPLLPELLTDLEDLGACAGKIVELLRPLALPAGARVLDLGSGKGAVLLALAAELKVTGVGVDAFPPFVEAAPRAAHRRGLGDRCSFRCGDLREFALEGEPFDVAMMLGLGLAIGDQREIVGLLRRFVRPGGYLVVDDAFLPEGVDGSVLGYDGYAEHATTLARLQSFGDEILTEECGHPRDTVRRIQADTEEIRRRAAALARRLPDRAEEIRAYVERQEREAELARESVIDALWLLRRTWSPAEDGRAD
jgi:cyclopropane fatty-acyl-phospholipid synthase-like methyltransferase